MRLALPAVLLACQAAGPVWSQEMMAEQPPTQRCLMPMQPELGQPEYPFPLWKGGQGGRVVVELEFTEPDARPKATIVEREGEEDLADAVLTHVRKLRLPCLESVEAPARLRQEYVFRPSTREVRSNPQPDAEELRRDRMFACVMHVSGDHAPSYPESAQWGGIQGRVVARLTFFAPDQPPRAEILARDSARSLARRVESFVKGYRMPCHEGGPVRSIITYVYVMENEAYGFKENSFRQYLGNIRNIELQRVNFDTTQMSCPFDVRIHYFKPLARNLVYERGTRNPARTALLEWLRDSELQVSSHMADALFGDKLLLTIPCVKIDLKPKE